MKKILQKESPLLRKKSLPVPLSTITTPKIQKILVEMKEALESQEDGVAIAAPQIGYSMRIFIVSHRVAKITKKNELEQSGSNKPYKISTATDDLVFINPTLKKVSKKKDFVEEGCLSVRFLYGLVRRGNKATIEAYNEHGRKFERGASGLLAQIFQHETDHLDGVLFIDTATHVEEIPPAQMISNKKHVE